MTTSKNTKARTTGTSKHRVTRDELRKQEALTHSAYEAGATTKDLIQLYSAEGTRGYLREFLRVAGRVLRRRDERLAFLLGDLEEFLPELTASYTCSSADHAAIMRRIRERVDEYNGPTAPEPFLEWAVPEVAGVIRSLNIVRKVETENRIAFADLYRRTYRAAFAGAWEILRHCRHLGATPDTARQVVSDTFAKIFLSAEDWRDDGEASLPTRVRAYAEWQARGWRTERLRERRKERRMRGAMRRYGLPVKTKRRCAAE